MSTSDSDNTYGWHDQGISWAEIKDAFALSLTIALAVLLLF